jgi:hypothetical protein
VDQVTTKLLSKAAEVLRDSAFEMEGAANELEDEPQHKSTAMTLKAWALESRKMALKLEREAIR